MPPIKDEFLASYARKLKYSAFKLSIEGPILLVFVNSFQIFSEGLLVRLTKLKAFLILNLT